MDRLWWLFLAVAGVGPWVLLALLLSGCALNGGGLIPNTAGPPGGSIHCTGACE